VVVRGDGRVALRKVAAEGHTRTHVVGAARGQRTMAAPPHASQRDAPHKPVLQEAKLDNLFLLDARQQAHGRHLAHGVPPCGLRTHARTATHTLACDLPRRTRSAQPRSHAYGLFPTVYHTPPRIWSRAYVRKGVLSRKRPIASQIKSAKPRDGPLSAGASRKGIHLFHYSTISS
jgi:hypothetical protein